jgi:glycosyltransferase involved in cell wall biosynthesis
MREEKLKVCYILPETAEDTATHFAHKWELIKELEDKVQFYVYQPTLLGIGKIKSAYFFHGCRIFYVHYSFKGALVAIILTKLFGGKVYYWNCGLPWLYTRGWFEERLFQFILRSTILVTGTAELAAEYILRYNLNPTRIRVIPNYIRVRNLQQINKTEARNKLNIPQDKKIVLFLHHISKRKGADLLPAIINEFKDTDNIVFLVVGDGPERGKLESCIKNNTFTVGVRIEGSVRHALVPLYFAASDVYLMPSQEEGMPNALLETMASGLPFVASDVGAVKEMSPPEARKFVLPYGDTHAFAGAIKKLLTDEELRVRISQEERTWAERYDVSIIAAKFLELIQR